MGHPDTRSLIAFVGLDGTGKTSAANELAPPGSNIAVFHPDEVLLDFSRADSFAPIDRPMHLAWQRALLKENRDAFITPISRLFEKHDTVILDGPFLDLAALQGIGSQLHTNLHVVPFEAKAIIRFLRLVTPISPKKRAATPLRSFPAFLSSEKKLINSSIFQRVMDVRDPIDTTTMRRAEVIASIMMAMETEQRAA